MFKDYHNCYQRQQYQQYLIKSLLSFLIASAIFLFLPKVVFAASINLSNAPSQLPGPEAEYPVDIVLSISVSDGTTYYLRGVFYKPGTFKYCGYTWNGSAWFSGPYSADQGWKNFLEITIQSSSWSGQLKAELDPEDTDCQESGTYNFKVQRFTQNGSASFDSQNELQVEVIVPTPTPTSEPTEEPEPTDTPTPTPTPIPTPTKKPTPTLIPTPTGEILGEGESATNAFYPLATEEAESTSQSGSSFKTRWLPKILLGIGFLLLFGASFWVWYTKLRWPEQESS